MKRYLALALVVFLSACQNPVQYMGPTERGVRFRALPPAIGGGISSSVKREGEFAFVIPGIERMYRFDTSIQSLEWGARGEGDNPNSEDYVQTRALDGNEVALAVKIEYRVSKDPEKLVLLAEEVAISNREVKDIVIAVARADLRTYMNQLKTAQFFVNESKFSGQDKAKDAMLKRLAPYGIDVVSVNLRQHRFGEEYQKMIDDVQTTREETGREIDRKETVARAKERGFNDMQAKVNRLLQEADRDKKAAVLNGDAYLKTRLNESKGILATGKAEVEGMTEKINALSGPGGKAILKLEVANQLTKGSPKFVTLGTGQSGKGLEVQRVDTNRLLEQIGVVEGLREDQPKKEPKKLSK